MRNWKLLLELIKKKAECKPTRTLKPIASTPTPLSPISPIPTEPAISSSTVVNNAVNATEKISSKEEVSVGKAANLLTSPESTQTASTSPPSRTAPVHLHQHSNLPIALPPSTPLLTYPDLLAVVDPIAAEIAAKKSNNQLAEEVIAKLEEIAKKVRENLLHDQVYKKAIFNLLWEHFSALDLKGMFGQPVRPYSTFCSDSYTCKLKP